MSRAWLTMFLLSSLTCGTVVQMVSLKRTIVENCDGKKSEYCNSQFNYIVTSGVKWKPEEIEDLPAYVQLSAFSTEPGESELLLFDDTRLVGRVTLGPCDIGPRKVYYTAGETVTFTVLRR